MTLASLA
jgi:hypothetical protein